MDVKTKIYSIFCYIFYFSCFCSAQMRKEWNQALLKYVIVHLTPSECILEHNTTLVKCSSIFTHLFLWKRKISCIILFNILFFCVLSIFFLLLLYCCCCCCCLSAMSILFTLSKWMLIVKGSIAAKRWKKYTFCDALQDSDLHKRKNQRFKWIWEYTYIFFHFLSCDAFLFNKRIPNRNKLIISASAKQNIIFKSHWNIFFFFAQIWPVCSTMDSSHFCWYCYCYFLLWCDLWRRSIWNIVFYMMNNFLLLLVLDSNIAEEN